MSSKIQKVTKNLRRWSKEEFGNIQSKINILCDKLGQIQYRRESDLLNDQISLEEKELRNEIEAMLDKEEIM